MGLSYEDQKELELHIEKVKAEADIYKAKHISKLQIILNYKYIWPIVASILACISSCYILGSADYRAKLKHDEEMYKLETARMASTVLKELQREDQ